MVSTHIGLGSPNNTLFTIHLITPKSRGMLVAGISTLLHEDAGWLRHSIRRRFIMRRTPGGPTSERQEPDDRLFISLAVSDDTDPTIPDISGRPYLLELLYTHFQKEKYAGQ